MSSLAATGNCQNFASGKTAVSSEAYEDAMDALRLYSVRHPEWAPVRQAIDTYVRSLHRTVGLQEPGV